MSDKVELFTWDLEKILGLKLQIPDYQRIYCWLKKNVLQLLEDIQSIKEEYRLGTIILQKKEDNNSFVYDIIDGQQRLVTLSLILLQLGDERSPLLEQSLQSDEAYEYVSYNKFLIKNYIEKFSKNFDVNIILTKLTFNVLVLNDSSLDLAYTFFSNENSR